jgi:hypothetical protein
MSTPPTADAAPVPRRNPYRGPREFRRGDTLPNRQREARELTDLVVAERVVLLHSPSGAGKTSLIEAGVVRELFQEGLYATPRLRFNEPPADKRVRNRYVHSLATYLLSRDNGTEPPHDLTLREAVGRWRALGQPTDTRTVLVMDQLEEVLILDPTDWGAKEEFFREFGRLLNTEPVWAVLSMREDYMGGLDRYVRFLPGLLRARYRLDFLSRTDAKLAIQVPAQQQGISFGTEAAEALVDRLAVVQVDRPGEGQIAAEAPYVEPFQLQVVCRLLWKNMLKHRGHDFQTIEVADVEKHVDIDDALTHYYGQIIADVVRNTGADERRIRDWFEFELITKARFRRQTLGHPQTTDPEKVVSLLEDSYLIRRDVRGPSTWHELAHDRLIAPVITGNATWRWETLDHWQIAAHEWNANDRNPAFLFPAKQLPATLRNDLLNFEQDFIAAAENQARQSGMLARTRTAMTLLACVAIAEGVVIVLLLFNLIAS